MTAEGAWTRREKIDADTMLESRIEVGQPDDRGLYSMSSDTLMRVLTEAGYRRPEDPQ